MTSLMPDGVSRTGMFHVRDTGDTCGYGGLICEPHIRPRSEGPNGVYFGEVFAAPAAPMTDRAIAESAIEQITFAHGAMSVEDYPLGEIPVEYTGTEIAAPDQRRAYT